MRKLMDLGHYIQNQLTPSKMIIKGGKMGLLSAYSKLQGLEDMLRLFNLMALRKELKKIIFLEIERICKKYPEFDCDS